MCTLGIQGSRNLPLPSGLPLVIDEDLDLMLTRLALLRLGDIDLGVVELDQVVVGGSLRGL